MLSNKLSLADIYNKLHALEVETKDKLNYLYTLFTEQNHFPIDVSIEDDAPGLWPGQGIQLYSIIPSMNISEMFCTTGVIIHFAANKYMFQIMYVIDDITDNNKKDKIYIRRGDILGNNWSMWELLNTSKNTFQSLAYKGYMRRKSQEVVINIDPECNYTEIALAIGGYYSVDMKKEYVNNVRTIKGILDDLQEKVQSFSGNLLNVNEGDALIYTDDKYIAIYDGAGGCFGSSVEPGSVEHFDNCLEINEMLPIKVIKL